MEFENLLKSFTSYAKSFQNESKEKNKLFLLKEEHSLRVAQNATDIAKSIGLSDEEVELAQISGLFHDVARFEQLKLYNTFNDAKSFDHGSYALKVIAREKFLKSLKPAKLKTVLKAIFFHNKAKLPNEKDEKKLVFMKILRDADKLDIWQVVIDHYNNKHNLDNNIMTLSVETKASFSPSIVNSILNSQIAKSTDIKTLTDFKLLHISWIFDLNFKKTFQVVQSKKYIEQISSFLPDSPELDKVKKFVLDYLLEILN